MKHPTSPSVTLSPGPNGFYSRRSWIVPRISLALVLCVFLLSGCLGDSADSTPDPAYTPTPTETPTATPTPLPLGSPGNPLILASVAASGPAAFAPSQDLAAQLTSLTGLTVTAREFATYVDVISNMANGDIHIAWMPPLTYLLVSRRGIVEAALLTNHFGVYFYGTQIMVNLASGLTASFDPISGQNTTDAATALAQLAGKRPCYVDPGSAAGYVVPAGLLELAGVQVLDPAFVQSHPAVVRALYIQGVCDFGATFSISGDPRTSASVLSDLLDARERIIILYQSDAVVPNINISYLAGLPEDMRLLLNTAFLDLANTSDGRDLLTAAAGNYQVEALKVIDDASYDPLRELSTAIDLDLSQLVGK